MYTFGKWSAAINNENQAINSTWTVPVFGNTSGEPCYPTWCQQAWRWQLDNITDPNGNMSEFTYVLENNMYAILGVPAYSTSYVMGGQLDYVRYGRNDAMGIVYRGKTDFEIKNRCFSTIEATACMFPGGNETPWYADAPTDLECSGNCVGKSAPSFFTKKIVDNVYTQSWNGAGWVNTDLTDLQFDWPDADGFNVGQPPQLWLRKINRTGYTGTGAVALPAVYLDSVSSFLDNRAEAGTQKLFWRLDRIFNELGERTQVQYGQPHGGNGTCTFAQAGSVSNATDCYERRSANGWALYNKYLVSTVTRYDNTTAGSPAQLTQYGYNDTPAWRHNADPLLDPTYWTWNEFRGHGNVTVWADGGAEATDHRFFRGMNGDYLRGPVSMTYNGWTQADDPWLRGAEYQTNYWNGGLVGYDYTKYYALCAVNTSCGAIAAVVDISDHLTYSTGGWKTTRTDQDVDAYGNTTFLMDYGDLAVTTDDRCNQTGYVANTSAWIVNTPHSSIVHAGTCAGTWLSYSVFHYDGNNDPATGWYQPPSKGNLTLRRQYLTGASEARTTTTYDNAGRVLTVDGPRSGVNDTVTTTYHPTFGYPQTITNGLSHVTTNVFDPARMQPTTVTDPNGRVTSYQYDGVGRLGKVWTADESTAGASAVEFTYDLGVLGGTGTPTTPPKVKTSVLQTAGGSRLDSYVYYDGLGQGIQSQRPGPNGGRIVNTSVYNGRGLVVRQSADYHAAGAPGAGFAAMGNPPRETRVTYDAFRRPTLSAIYTAGAALSTGGVPEETSISYNGWETTIDPPAPLVKSMQLVDGRGRVAETRRYLDAVNYSWTTYTYDLLDNQLTKTDPSGAVTSATYDWASRPTQTVDPDAGTTTLVYDEGGNVTSRTNPLGTTWMAYDVLGRPTQRRATNSTGQIQATWSYDAPGQKGLLDRTVAYDNGAVLYTTDVGTYDARNRPQSTTYTVASLTGWTNTGLAGSYTIAHTYDKADRQATITYPAAGGLGAETVTTGYNTTGQATTLTGSYNYVASTNFNNWGPVSQRVLGTGAGSSSVTRAYGWNQATGRLDTLTATRGGAFGAASAQGLTYTYNALGDPIDIADSVAGQRQCFGYDAYNRLEHAYSTSTATACSAISSSLTGPGPYNERYSYDPADRIITFGPTNANSTAGVNTYTYPATGKRHAVSSIATPAGADTYTYDGAGNRIGFVNFDGPTQTNQWDTLGRLKSTKVNNDTPPVHRNTTSASTSGAATSLTINKPAGTIAGDLMIAYLVMTKPTGATAYPTITAPAGWTVVQDRATASPRVIAYRQTATATTASSFTFSFSAPVKTLAGISSHGNTDGIVASSGRTVTTAGTTHMSAWLDLTYNQTRVDIVGLNGVTTATPPSGSTERLDLATAAGAPEATMTVSDRVAPTTLTGLLATTSAIATTSQSVNIVLAGGSKTTTNMYDIDRQRILRKDPNGDITLYIAGALELKKPAGAGAVAGTRYYSIGGSNVALRNTAVLDWIIGDAQGSATTTIDYGSGTIRQQYYTPYGNPRGTAAGFSTEHGFLNQTRDTNTGLSYLNNRYHDPTTGTFLSVDPLVGATGMPYLYGNGNPVTFSDPSGLFAQCELNDSCAGGSNAPGRPKATTPVVENEDAVVRELHRCMNGFRTCNEQRTDARNAGESTPILDLVVDFLYGMAANGILRQNSEGGLVSSNPNQTAQVFGFSVHQENQKFVVLAIAADVNPGTVEDLLEDVGLILNLAELGAWGSCAATGVTCPAVIPISGASAAMDVVNASVDVGQGDWGEAFTGVATVGMSQVVSRTPWPGSSALAEFNVGAAELAMSSALDGLNGVYTGPDGSEYDFDAFIRSYSVAA